MNSTKTSLLVGFGLVLIAALSRFLPHPYNFSPIDGIALFSGGMLWTRNSIKLNKYLAFLIPLLAMLVSDAVIGFHATMPFVYGSLALMVLIGRSAGERPSRESLLKISLASSCIFFLITNFGYWITTLTYPKTLNGILACYTAAIPFFHWTLLGDLFFVFSFYGVFSFLTESLERKRCRQEF